MLHVLTLSCQEQTCLDGGGGGGGGGGGDCPPSNHGRSRNEQVTNVAQAKGRKYLLLEAFFFMNGK